MVLTLFFLALVYFIFIAVLAYLGVGSLVLLIIATGALLLQFFFSDRLALMTMGARIVSEQEEPRLYETVVRLCAIADMPSPRIAIVKNQIPNAFATGRSPGSSVVAVTTGLKDMLSREELEAVLAHELSHVKNRDVMVMTLAGVISTAAFFLFRSFLAGGMRSTGSREGGGKGAWILIPLLSAVVWAASFLLIRALSRYREYAADRGSAVLTGNPSHLASALMKISGIMKRVPDEDLRKVEGMNAFFIFPALSSSSIFQLFSTHPTVEQRIEALSRLEQELGSHGF